MQVIALSDLAQTLAQAARREQTEQVIGRIKDDRVKSRILSALSQALAQAGRWEQAEQVIDGIRDDEAQMQALSALSQALAQAGRWEQAEQVITRIEDDRGKDDLLVKLAAQMSTTDEYELLLHLTWRQWWLAGTREQALIRYRMAIHFISSHPTLGIALYNAFTWVDMFLQA